MVDTHCHIYKEYYDDIPKLVEQIKKAGIKKIIVNGCDMKSNMEVLELVKEYDIVYGAIGFHPTELTTNDDEMISFLEAHINDNKIVALGEIGLDYHYDNTDKLRQYAAFKKQLELAEKYKKPIIVHSRDAIWDTYNIMSRYNLKGSIHAFSGSAEMAQAFIKLGYYIGVGGVCTYKNAKNIVNVIENIPLAYILLETDSPYLTPDPFRGQTNTPANIPIIAKKVSEIKNVSLPKVVKDTTTNANQLFDF